MNNCPSCAAENTEASKFCSECGAALRPEYQATIPFHIGIHKTLDWFHADEKRMQYPAEHEQFLDDLIAAYAGR